MRNSNDLKQFAAPVFGGETLAGKGGGTTGEGSTFGNDGNYQSPPFNPTGGTIYGPGTGIIPGAERGITKTIEVIDKDGKPLAGAHLTWKDGSKNVGTTTAANGYATVNVPSESTSISITFLGKRTHITTYANLGSLITLQDNVNSLPPVVVGPKPPFVTTAPIATVKKNNLLKTAGIGIGALLLISMLTKKKTKTKAIGSGNGLSGTKGKKKKKKKSNGLREPVTVEL